MDGWVPLTRWVWATSTETPAEQTSRCMLDTKWKHSQTQRGKSTCNYVTVRLYKQVRTNNKLYQFAMNFRACSICRVFPTFRWLKHWNVGKVFLISKLISLSLLLMQETTEKQPSWVYSPMLHCTEGNSWSVSYKSTPLQVGQIHAQVMGEEPTQADRHAWMDSLERWTCMYTNEQTHKRTTKSGSVSQSSSSAWVIVFTSLLPNWDRHILRSWIYYLQIIIVHVDWLHRL